MKVAYISFNLRTRNFVDRVTIFCQKFPYYVIQSLHGSYSYSRAVYSYSSVKCQHKLPLPLKSCFHLIQSKVSKFGICVIRSLLWCSSIVFLYEKVVGGIIRLTGVYLIRLIIINFKMAAKQFQQRQNIFFRKPARRLDVPATYECTMNSSLENASSRIRTCHPEESQGSSREGTYKR